ncbi:MAG: hypothetical protein JNM89_15680 [Hyphomicrobiaceae bacterium]|nr:hypothetical protein [Hyphomicrobiaceae bacterium]
MARLIAANPTIKPTTAIKSLGITDPSVIRRLRDKFSEMRASAIAAAEEIPLLPSAAARSPSQQPAKVAARHRAVAARAYSEARRTAEPAHRDPQKPRSTKTRPAARKPRDASTTSVANVTLPDEGPDGCEPHLSGVITNTSVAEVDSSSAHRAEKAVAPLPASSMLAEQTQNEAVSLAEELPACALPKLSLKKSEDLFVALCGIGLAAANSAVAAQVSLAQNLVRSSYVSHALRRQLALNEWAIQLSPWPAVKATR